MACQTAWNHNYIDHVQITVLGNSGGGRTQQLQNGGCIAGHGAKSSVSAAGSSPYYVEPPLAFEAATFEMKNKGSSSDRAFDFGRSVSSYAQESIVQGDSKNTL